MSPPGKSDPVESEEQRQLRTDREESLLLRWKQGGRLSEKEFAEVRHRLPINSRLSAEAAANNSINPSGRANYEKQNLIEYESVFATKVRQIKNWIALGKAAKPAELPPLDSPGEMAAWWTRHMKQRVPAKLIALASQKTSGAAPNSSIVDLTKLVGAVGDALRKARAVRMATDQHLTEAYASGDDTKIEICQRRWLRAVEQERKLETAAREEAKASGDLIPRAELLPELSQFLEVMHQMRRSARRRILARFHVDLSPELAEALGIAIEQELERGDAVLRQLKQFRTLEEIDQFELTAGE
jgi:hypothetical protein